MIASSGLWMRNVQLGLISIVIGLFGVYSKDGALVAEKGFYQGYSNLVWAVILLQSLGGLVVASPSLISPTLARTHTAAHMCIHMCPLRWILWLGVLHHASAAHFLLLPFASSPDMLAHAGTQPLP